MQTPSVNARPDCETVEIDGVQRPTRCSRGRLIAGGDIDKLHTFWRWFGDSHAVGAGGAPIVAYHGTAGELEGGQFDLARSGSNFEDIGRGEGFICFTNDSGEHGFPTGTNAREYANHAASRRDEGPNIVPAFLHIQNPLYIDADGWGSVVKAFDSQESDIRRWLREGGHDGVIVEDAGSSIDEHDTPERMYVVIDPKQIKSAVGNPGSFDPEDPRISDQADWAVDRKPARRPRP